MAAVVAERGVVTPESRSDTLELIYRAILVRQHEGMQAILELARSDHGHAAGALLRQSCEELIWVRYLKQIDRSDANTLLLAMTSLEIRGQLKAQRNYSGAEVMDELGLSRYFGPSKKTSRIARGYLQEIGKKLEWPDGWQEKGPLPSLAFIASQTGSMELYEFLYHASSRSVHFRVQDLLRRAWTDGRTITITSATYRDYWTAFSTYWGFHLYFQTFSSWAISWSSRPSLTRPLLWRQSS